MSGTELHKYRVRVFVDDPHPPEKNDDDMTVRSTLDAKTIKVLVKQWLGECLSFQKMAADAVIQ